MIGSRLRLPNAGDKPNGAARVARSLPPVVEAYEQLSEAERSFREIRDVIEMPIYDHRPDFPSIGKVRQGRLTPK